MPRDDAERLLGGYATNTLTEQERKELFEAALADQTLFDALANEQAFKELLEDPRARRLLIEALQEKQPRRSAFHNLYAWLLRPSSLALAGGVAVVFLAITLVIQLTPASKAPDRSAATFPSLSVEPSAPPVEPSAPKENQETGASRHPRRSAPPKLLAPSHEGGGSPLPKTATSSEAPAAPGASLKEDEQARIARGQAMPSAPPQEFASDKPLTQTLGENAPERQTSENKPEKFREEARPFSPMGSPMARSQGLAKTEPLPPPIRFTILKQDRQGTENEVDPSFIFRTEDKARLAIEPNDDGYLYVLARNKAGGSKLLFPSPGTIEASEKTARVEKKVRYLIPPIGVLTFEDPGDQRMTVLFSRAPLTDVQNLIEAPLADQAKTENLSAAKTVKRIEITLKHQ